MWTVAMSTCDRPKITKLEEPPIPGRAGMYVELNDGSSFCLSRYDPSIFAKLKIGNVVIINLYKLDDEPQVGQVGVYEERSGPLQGETHLHLIANFELTGHYALVFTDTLKP